MTGQVVSHYRVLDQLGEGGMGVVYRAEDLRLKRHVAIKFLSSPRSAEPAAVERFRREAEAASALNHPHICTVHDVGHHDGQPYLVLELLEGQSLARMVAAGPLSTERTITYALQIADALDAAHAKGIVHRDLKPSNIWVTARGDAKILDFGVAKLADAKATGQTATSTQLVVTAPGVSVGTPQYMSPEQVRGEAADARSDLFSLGLVIYEMATGRPAFSGATVGVVLDAVLNRAPEPASALVHTAPPALEQIIVKAIEKDPALRYQSARDLMADLRRTLRDVARTTPSAGARESGSSNVKPRRSSLRHLGPLSVGVAVFALAAAGWLVWRDRPLPAAPAHEAVPVGRARLVVLPFENLTGQSADAWLAGAFPMRSAPVCSRSIASSSSRASALWSSTPPNRGRSRSHSVPSSRGRSRKSSASDTTCTGAISGLVTISASSRVWSTPNGMRSRRRKPSPTEWPMSSRSRTIWRRALPRALVVRRPRRCHLNRRRLTPTRRLSTPARSTRLVAFPRRACSSRGPWIEPPLRSGVGVAEQDRLAPRGAVKFRRVSAPRRTVATGTHRGDYRRDAGARSRRR